jgi:NAD(P)-dependent dehydrogenase (short-subunit alcohol dehydrogenase family)
MGKSLNDRVVSLAGASRGIGLTAALALVHEGALVLFAVRSKDVRPVREAA